jgi:hypothetical protein
LFHFFGKEFVIQVITSANKKIAFGELKLFMETINYTSHATLHAKKGQPILSRDHQNYWER